MRKFYGDILTNNHMIIITKPCSSEDEARRLTDEWWENLRKNHRFTYMDMYGLPYGVIATEEDYSFDDDKLGLRTAIPESMNHIYADMR